MVKYRDVGYVLPWLMQIRFFASPVAYSLNAVPEDLKLLFYLNPLAWMVELFRSSMLGTEPAEWWLAPASVVATGWWLSWPGSSPSRPRSEPSPT